MNESREIESFSDEVADMVSRCLESGTGSLLVVNQDRRRQRWVESHFRHHMDQSGLSPVREVVVVVYSMG